MKYFIYLSLLISIFLIKSAYVSIMYQNIELEIVILNLSQIVIYSKLWERPDEVFKVFKKNSNH